MLAKASIIFISFFFFLANGEVDGCKHGVQLNDLNFDELYVEYDDIEAALVEETKIDPEEGISNRKISILDFQ